jgi:hypothetical protein
MSFSGRKDYKLEIQLLWGALRRKVKGGMHSSELVTDLRKRRVRARN